MQAVHETQSRRLDTEPGFDWPDEDPLAECRGPIPAFDQFPPAEACTELGASPAPARLSWWRRLLIARARWQLGCIASEREHYLSLGWVGPVYLVNSYAEEAKLAERIRKLGGEVAA